MFTTGETVGLAERIIDDTCPVVLQEYVITHTGDSFPNGQRVSICGTEDVLTCHVIILHHPFTGTLGLAHFDEFFKENGLMKQFLESFLLRVRQRYFYSQDDDDFDEQDEGLDDDWEWEEMDDDGENDELNDLG